jgi:hypothetical protein
MASEMIGGAGGSSGAKGGYLLGDRFDRYCEGSPIRLPDYLEAAGTLS